MTRFKNKPEKEKKYNFEYKQCCDLHYRIKNSNFLILKFGNIKTITH